MDEEDSLRASLKMAIGATTGLAGDHVGEDEMIEYYRLGKWPARDQSVSAAHLTECPQCIARFRDVRDFFSAPRADEVDAGDISKTRMWRNVETALGHRAAPVIRSMPPVRERRVGGFLAPVLAASLVLVAVLGAVWGLQLRRQRNQLAAQLQSERRDYEQRLGESERANAQLQQQAESARKGYEEELDRERKRASAADAQSLAETRGAEVSALVNVPIFDAFPEQAVQRSAEGSSAVHIKLPGGSTNFVLILNGGGQPDYSSYEIVISERKSRVVWRRAGAKRDRTGNFNLMLSKKVTPPGEYVVRVTGRSGQRDEPVADYRIIVE